MSGEPLNIQLQLTSTNVDDAGLDKMIAELLPQLSHTKGAGILSPARMSIPNPIPKGAV